MGNFDSLTNTGKHDRMFANYISGSNGLESDGFAISLAGLSFSTIYGTFL